MDEFCSSKFNNDPMGKYLDLKEDIQKGSNQCANSINLTYLQFKFILGDFQNMDKVKIRNFIPAIIYRLIRCNDQDKQALRNLLEFSKQNCDFPPNFDIKRSKIYLKD
jgi:hypothetical protein